MKLFILYMSLLFLILISSIVSLYSNFQQRYLRKNDLFREPRMYGQVSFGGYGGKIFPERKVVRKRRKQRFWWR